MDKPALKLLFPADSLAGLSGPSIFLAGPTPRSVEVFSWRPAALDHLTTLGFSGTVLVPERKNWSAGSHYIDQIEWELAGLESASVVAFWVPRHMVDMLALTTNVEFGMLVKYHKIVYGRPDSAVHTRYLDYLYHKFTGMFALNELSSLMSKAMEVANG